MEGAYREHGNGLRPQASAWRDSHPCACHGLAACPDRHPAGLRLLGLGACDWRGRRGEHRMGLSRLPGGNALAPGAGELLSLTALSQTGESRPDSSALTSQPTDLDLRNRTPTDSPDTRYETTDQKVAQDGRAISGPLTAWLTGRSCARGTSNGDSNGSSHRLTAATDDSG